MQLPLWQWSVAVHCLSIAAITLFFGILARFLPLRGLRCWVAAWAANLIALIFALFYWITSAGSELSERTFDVVKGVYLGNKTAFICLLVLGAVLLERPATWRVPKRLLAIVL